MDGPAHPAEELDERVCVGGKKRSGDHLARFLLRRRQRGCLMDIEPDILRSPFPESRSLLWSMVPRHLHGSSKGRALIMCQLDAKRIPIRTGLNLE